MSYGLKKDLKNLKKYLIEFSEISFSDAQFFCNGGLNSFGETFATFIIIFYNCRQVSARRTILDEIEIL